MPHRLYYICTEDEGERLFLFHTVHSAPNGEMSGAGRLGETHNTAHRAIAPMSGAERLGCDNDLFLIILEKRLDF